MIQFHILANVCHFILLKILVAQICSLLLSKSNLHLPFQAILGNWDQHFCRVTVPQAIITPGRGSRLCISHQVIPSCLKQEQQEATGRPASPQTAGTWQHRTSRRGLENLLKRRASERQRIATSPLQTQVPSSRTRPFQAGLERPRTRELQKQREPNKPPALPPHLLSR